MEREVAAHSPEWFLSSQELMWLQGGGSHPQRVPGLPGAGYRTRAAKQNETFSYQGQAGGFWSPPLASCRPSLCSACSG